MSVAIAHPTPAPPPTPIHPPRVERAARLRWVAIAAIEYPDRAQREKISAARVAKIAANFDPEQFGTPTVNEINGVFHAADGMHRIEACKLMGWADQQIQCWVYVGLSDAEMANLFLRLNDTLPVTAYDKFRVGVNAGYATEGDIDRIVRSQGLRISRDHNEGAIRAVGTLRRIYTRGGARTLCQTLIMVRDTYGSVGFEAITFDGLSMVVQRYGDTLDLVVAQAKLGSVHGGVNGLLGRAELIRRMTGQPKAQCVAAAAVEIINSGRGGHKLAPWFREENAK